MNVNEIKVKSLFSEESFYIVEKVDDSGVEFKHLQSGDIVKMTYDTIESVLKSADQYSEVIVVGKETSSKRKGIKEIFEGIHSKQVFTVCFKKQDKPLSASKLQKLKEEQIEKALEKIIKAKEQKKGILEVAKKELFELQNNPIYNFEEGEERVLRGYKIQFKSEDGRYDCVDVDIQDKNNVRQVNINSIKWIIFNNCKFIVE